jgi:hypothetical protein
MRESPGLFDIFREVELEAMLTLLDEATASPVALLSSSVVPYHILTRRFVGVIEAEMKLK